MRDAGLRDRGRRRRGKARAGGGGGVQASALFRAGLQNTLVPQAKGSATPTFTRATTATIEDFEGLVKSCISGEARFKGARRVQNLISVKSEDMTDANFTDANNAVSAATQTTYDGTANGAVFWNAAIVNHGAGLNTFVFSVNVKLISGTISSDAALNIELSGNGLTAVTANIGSTVSTTAQRFTVTASTDASGTQVLPKIIWDDAGVLEITEWMLEEVTGQGNQNPSEYVSTGVLSAPYHGANVDAVRYFKTLNGNSVASNVVTEADGALISASDSFADASGPFGRRVEGARINIALQSSVFENVAWTKSNVTATDNDAVSPAGTSTAALLLATAANGTVIQDLGTISSAAHRGGLWIKRKTGTGNIDLTIDNGSTWTTAAVTTTWARFFSVAVTAANPDIGIRLVTDTDAVWVWNGQAEAAPFLSSDIETTSSAVTRNADVLTFVSASNILDATGTMVCEAASDWATADAQSTLFDTGSMTVYTGAGLASTTMKAEDGTNTVALTGGATMENSPQKIAVTWGVALDVYSEAINATGSFDGSLNSATNFGIGCTDAGGTQFFGTIRNVKIFKKELSASQVAGL